MRAPIDGKTDIATRLENEVAAWRRRAVRPGTTIGKIRVVRIPKRDNRPVRLATARSLAAAQP
jgi:hypothetical protein